jgi:hypothetical protein
MYFNMKITLKNNRNHTPKQGRINSLDFFFQTNLSVNFDPQNFLKFSINYFHPYLS